MPKILDMNAYFGSWPYWRIRNTHPSDILSIASKHGIDKLGVSSLRAVLLDWVKGNEETFRVCANNPEHLVPVVTVSPFWIDELPDLLDDYALRGMRALRLFPSFHGYLVGAYEEFLDILEWVSSKGFPVIYSMRLFMNWGLPVENVADIFVLAEHTPNSPLIVSGINWSEMMKVLPLIEQCPNLYFDVSCLSSRRGLEMLVRHAGCHRVLFGSALPFQEPGAIIANVESLPLDEAELEQVMSLNAYKLFCREADSPKEQNA